MGPVQGRIDDGTRGRRVFEPTNRGPQGSAAVPRGPHLIDTGEIVKIASEKNVYWETMAVEEQQSSLGKQNNHYI